MFLEVEAGDVGEARAGSDKERRGAVKGDEGKIEVMQGTKVREHCIIMTIYMICMPMSPNARCLRINAQDDVSPFTLLFPRSFVQQSRELQSIPRRLVNMLESIGSQ